MRTPYMIEVSQTLENHDAVREIILEFYTFQVQRLIECGGPELSPERPASGFWDHVENYFAPKGASTIAKSEQGKLTGIVAMTDTGEGIAELKYLYVRPEARGTGLGRELVRKRVDIARGMGLSRLCVDTLKSSVEMHGLYESMGFIEVMDFPQSKTVRDLSEVRPFLKFYEMRL